MAGTVRGARWQRDPRRRALSKEGTAHLGPSTALCKLNAAQARSALDAPAMRTNSTSKRLVEREILDVAGIFLKRLDGRYPVRGGILFGSRARASHGKDSDADLAVVLAGTGTSGDRRSASRDMAGIAFDILMETGVLVDPLPLWEDELEGRVAFSNPALIDAIWRDGVRL